MRKNHASQAIQFAEATAQLLPHGRGEGRGLTRIMR